MKNRRSNLGQRCKVKAKAAVPLVTEQLLVRSKMELIPLGLERAMERLRSVEPVLHRGIQNGAADAIADLDDDQITAEALNRIQEALQGLALSLIEAVRRAYGTPDAAPIKSGDNLQNPCKTNGVVTAYTARLLNCHRPRQGAGADVSFVGFTLERAKGIADHIAISYPEAVKLVRALIRNLIAGECEEARNAWGAKPDQRTGFPPIESKDSPTDSSPELNGPARRARASDKLVFRELLLCQQSRVRKTGIYKALQDLSDLEPSIADYVSDGVLKILNSLRNLGVSNDLVDTLGDAMTLSSLTIITSIQKAHFDLWKDSMSGTLLEQLDPDLKRPRAK